MFDSRSVLIVALAATLLTDAAPHDPASRVALSATVREPSIHDFDAMLGTWTFTAHTKNPRSPKPEFGGDWTWSRTGVNYLIEDDYRVVDATGTQQYLGVTYRAYNAATKQWTNAFVQPPGAKWSIAAAWRDGADMVEGPTDSTAHTRARFVFVDPDHFIWHFDRSNDGGRSWINDYVRVDAHRETTR
jgi:hypothetical protein